MPGQEWGDREIDRGAALDREVDRLRGVYRDHAETLSRLASTSPSKQLARRYQELLADINKAIVGLDDVDHDVVERRSGEHPVPPAEGTRPEPPPRTPQAAPAAEQHPEPERPVLSTYSAAATPAEGDDGTVMRVALIIGLAIVLLGVLALFVWKFSGARPAPTTTAATEPAVAPPPKEEPVTPVPEPKPGPESLLRVTPQQHDFGSIAKGTSAVRTFELTNRGKSPLTIEISRSKCRCLWYDPPKGLPPGGRGTLTIRVDGSRAPAGILTESVEVSAKGNRDAVVVIEITAEVK